MEKLFQIARPASQKDSVQQISEENHAVLEEISTILKRIDAVESTLSLETDEDLIDAGVYEIKSLNCRYTYYLKQAKKLGITGVGR